MWPNLKVKTPGGTSFRGVATPSWVLPPESGSQVKITKQNPFMLLAEKGGK